jgi:chromosome segregation ATPase
MEPHQHADYEATFKRIATVLDVIVESQSRHAQEMAEIREAHARLEHTVERASQTVDRASVLIEKLAIKSTEHEDKLNALINLMDQHIDDHYRDK